MTSTSSSSSSSSRRQEQDKGWNRIENFVELQLELPVPLPETKFLSARPGFGACMTKAGYCKHGTIFKIVTHGPAMPFFPLEHSQNLLTFGTECAVIRVSGSERPSIYGALFYLRQAFYHLYMRNRARNVQAYQNVLNNCPDDGSVSLVQQSQKIFSRYRTDISVRLILAGAIIEERDVQEIAFMKQAGFINALDLINCECMFLSSLISKALADTGFRIAYRQSPARSLDLFFCSKVRPSRVTLNPSLSEFIGTITFDYELDFLEISYPDIVEFETCEKPVHASWLVLALKKRVSHLCVYARALRGEIALLRMISDLSIETCTLSIPIPDIHLDIGLALPLLPDDLILHFRKDFGFFERGGIFKIVQDLLRVDEDKERKDKDSFNNKLVRMFAYRPISGVELREGEKALETQLMHIQHPMSSHETVLHFLIRTHAGVRISMFTRAAYWLKYVRARSDMIKYELLRSHMLRKHHPEFPEALCALVCDMAGLNVAPRIDAINGAKASTQFNHKCSDCPSLLESGVEDMVDRYDIAVEKPLTITYPAPSKNELKRAKLAFDHPNQEDFEEELLRGVNNADEPIDLTDANTQAEDDTKNEVPDTTQASQAGDDGDDLNKGDAPWYPGKRTGWEDANPKKKRPRVERKRADIDDKKKKR